ncbi:Hypothetical protein, putative [Bodo saltans]|uniref:Uncharacterized protein n=1 Tax=Bodo saltans TaxID=75058 RepID=A0A0S4J0S1_BODSA|nr:Hypothetical protein, putative [Bodo saltans]|eukprot:CUG77261.1 Hypothetical protein, putative [Bodo saltans]
MVSSGSTTVAPATQSLDPRAIITVPISHHLETLRDDSNNMRRSENRGQHSGKAAMYDDGDTAVAHKEEEALWITRWDCEKKKNRMQIASTEVAVDHLRRDLRAQRGGDVENHSLLSPVVTPEVEGERESNRLREIVVALTARQQSVEITKTAVIAQVTEGRRSRALAASRHRWQLSHLESELESTLNQILRTSSLRDQIDAQHQRLQGTSQRRLEDLQRRIHDERRSVYQEKEGQRGGDAAPPGWNNATTTTSRNENNGDLFDETAHDMSPTSILMRSVEKAKEELRVLDEACHTLEEEGRRLEAASQLGVAVVLSHEQEVRLEHLMITKQGLIQALKVADEQHLKFSADLDVLEGQLMSSANINNNSTGVEGEPHVDDAATAEAIHHRRVMSDDWRRRFVDQLTALRQRLKSVRDASRSHRERRQASVIKTRVKLPAAIKVSSVARVDMTQESRAAILQLNDTLEDWSAQLRVHEKKIDVERRTQDHLLSREAQLIEDIANGKRQLQTIDGLVAAYRVASSQFGHH